MCVRRKVRNIYFLLVFKGFEGGRGAGGRSWEVENTDFPMVFHGFWELGGRKY